MTHSGLLQIDIDYRKILIPHENIAGIRLNTVDFTIDIQLHKAIPALIEKGDNTENIQLKQGTYFESMELFKEISECIRSNKFCTFPKK